MTENFDLQSATENSVPTDIADYLSACFRNDDGDGALVLESLRNICQIYGIAKLSSESDLSQQELENALKRGENPEFVLILRVIKALGLKIHASTRTAAT